MWPVNPTHAVQEDRGLGHLGLFQVLLGPLEHDIGDVEAEEVVGMLEPDARVAVTIVQVLAHTGELAALSGENVSGHR